MNTAQADWDDQHGRRSAIAALDRIEANARQSVRVIDALIAGLVPGSDDLNDFNIFADCPRPLAVNTGD